MTKELRLPVFSDAIEGVEVASVLVKQGQSIELDQDIIEVHTDKAVVTIPSTLSGIIERIHTAKGEIVKSGDLIVTVT